MSFIDALPSPAAFWSAEATAQISTPTTAEPADETSVNLWYTLSYCLERYGFLLSHLVETPGHRQFTLTVQKNIRGGLHKCDLVLNFDDAAKLDDLLATSIPGSPFENQLEQRVFAGFKAIAALAGRDSFSSEINISADGLVTTPEALFSPTAPYFYQGDDTLTLGSCDELASPDCRWSHLQARHAQSLRHSGERLRAIHEKWQQSILRQMNDPTITRFAAHYQIAYATDPFNGELIKTSVITIDSNLTGAFILTTSSDVQSSADNAPCPDSIVLIGVRTAIAAQQNDTWNRKIDISLEDGVPEIKPGTTV